MIVATTIELFKNIAQYDFENHYYDLHNDYDCQKILFSMGTLSLIFKNIIDASLLLLKFIDVEITKVDFYNIGNVENLTIDNIYRGRMEMRGELKDVSEDAKAYFYLEFYEGQTLEFWANCIEIEK